MEALRPIKEVEVEEEGVEIDSENEGQNGEREVKKLNSPIKPSKEEIETHNLTHLPYRNWCRHCVRGRGKEAAHRTGTGEIGDHPEFHFDWCFPGEEEAGKTLTVLVGRMRGTRMTMSSVSPSKSTGEFIARRIMAYLRECGCELAKIVVKTDQEPAIISMIEDLTKMRVDRGAEETVPENSVKGSSQSNGVVERGILAVEGMIRSLRSALEERIGTKLEVEDAIWPWLVEYSSYLLNRLEVGHDGKTAYERNKGKKAKVTGVEFGESVLWKRKPVGGALGKLAVMWEDGVFFGLRGPLTR